jgi:GntR family transcriptional regulator
LKREEAGTLIDFEGFVQTEGQPIYLQIMRYIKQGLASGIIADGEELPSRRALSAYLTVNPNTVQKAYRLLEEEELVQSHAGAKSFVCATERQRAALRRELTENELRGMVRNMKGMGLTAKEAAALVEKLYAEEENK